MSTNADSETQGSAEAREAGGAEGAEAGKGGSRRGAWTVPVTGVVMGAAFLAIYLGHHDVGMAVFGLVLMVGYAVFLVFGSRRSEAVSLLRGESGDERARSIAQRAAALTLYVLTVVLVGGYLVAVIRGSGETTWATLCGVLGATYMLSTVVLTRRG
jgi:hypothetical protein